MCFASGQNISVPLVGAFSLSIMPVEVKIVFGCIEAATKVDGFVSRIRCNICSRMQQQLVKQYGFCAFKFKDMMGALYYSKLHFVLISSAAEVFFTVVGWRYFST